jgi:hypothetical protein
VRAVFYLLLLVNVVFFAWSRWVDRPRDSAAASTHTAGMPALELAHVPAKPAPPPEPATHCRSIGPFADAAAASATADALKARGLQTRPRNVDTSVPDGYWVYVEDLKDAAARRKVLNVLNANGMRDAAAMDEAGRVSVGVFADQRHAVHRAEQVQELGFRPVLSLHQRTISNAWLDVDLKPNDAEPTPVAAPGPSAPVNPKSAPPEPVRVIDCPAMPEPTADRS